MKMSRKQCPTLINMVEMVETGITEGNPIFRSCSTTYFIHNNKGSGSGILQNRRSFKHLNHERRLVSIEIIRRSNLLITEVNISILQSKVTMLTRLYMWS